MVLRFLIEKEFKQIFRNKVFVMMIVGFPILVLLILPWGVTFDLKDIRVTVVDHSRGEYAQRLKGKIEASPYFLTTPESGSYEEAFIMVENGEADLALELPPDFDQLMATGATPTIFLAANAVDGTQSLLATSYVQSVIRDFSQELLRERALEVKVQSPIQVVPSFKYNARMDYKTFMLPAFIVLLTALLCGILPALNIVQEKEHGTIQQINVTPVRRFDFILSKIIPYWVIGLIVLVIGVAIIGLVYGLWPSGSWLGMLVISLVFILAISAMGIIVSNYARLMQQAMFIMMFFILVIILLSGLFTPITSMPPWAQAIAYLNPLTYYMDAMRIFYLRGGTFADGLPSLWKLALYGVGVSLWAVLSYKKVDK